MIGDEKSDQCAVVSGQLHKSFDKPLLTTEH